MNPSWWGNPAPDSGKYTSSGSTSSWWGTPAPDSGKYTSTSLSPSWAESPVSTSSQTNQWALVSNQTPSIQSIPLSESETGSLNRPPKLMHLDEYPGWADRFRTYVLGQNTELWIRFTTDFDQAIEVAASDTATFADLPEDQKKTYDLEKKAYAILTQALSKDIYHQFVSFKTTKKLWDGLKTRGVGNEATRQLRHDLLKKEFDGFACLDKESLGDMTSRFYHLLTELNNFGVATTQAEVVKKFADALPPQWNSFLEILKYNEVSATTNINDFMQLLENKDQEETLKAKRVPVPQNPEMYHGTSSTSTARSIVPSNPGSHAPLQTTFVTSTDMYGNPVQVPVKPPPTTDMYGNPIQPPPPAPAQACYGGTSSAGQQSKPDTVRLNTSKGILHEFSAAYTPQQNGVAERKNRTLIETARTMLVESQLPIPFWSEAVASACYTLNRVLTVKRHNKTCFELLQKRKPDLSYLEPFGAPCTMIDTNGKFGAKAIEGYFLGYATPNLRVWNLETKRVEEWSEVRVQRHTLPVKCPGQPWMFEYDDFFNSINVEAVEENAAARMFFESDNATVSPVVRPILVNQEPSSVNNNTLDNEDFHDATELNESSEDDEFLDADQDAPTTAVHGTSEGTPPVNAPRTAEATASSSSSIPGIDLVVDLNLNNLGINIPVRDNPETRIHNTHPQKNIIGNVQSGIQTRNMLRNNNNAGLYAAIRESGQQNDWSFACYVSQEEPRTWKEAMKDNSWVEVLVHLCLYFVCIRSVCKQCPSQSCKLT
ncbi:putative RNA-directed DNA polymerase [Helianthus debilis subsp. tardiflorus]